MDIDPKASRTSLHIVQQLPGTQEIPCGLSTFVIRLTNPAAGYDDKVRVENEVAALAVDRDALRTKLPHLVPRVFGWCSASNGQGWIVEEGMPGTLLLEEFDCMSDKDKDTILGQMAAILSAFNDFHFPIPFGNTEALTSAPGRACQRST